MGQGQSGKVLQVHGSHKASIQKIRIIGGQWKRSLLPVLHAEGLRPTPDRVRETLFNWLTHLLDGVWHDVTCLDLFAGTGALGFEAASRGAAQVVLVEGNRSIASQLEATRTKLNATGVDIVCSDALSAARRLATRNQEGQTRFDIIFLDPPYHQDWLVKIWSLCETLVSEKGLIYAESEHPLSVESMDWLKRWEIIRSDKAGVVFYHLLQRKKLPEFQA